MRHWLMKSEPEVFSIQDLKNQKTTLWEGVRNYQARNFMMRDMSIGDPVLFYHSNATPPGIAGIARVHSTAHADPTQFDLKSPYCDHRAKKDSPIWYCVEVAFVSQFPSFLSLQKLSQYRELKNMLVLKKGQRLSIQPVTPMEYELIIQIAHGL